MSVKLFEKEQLAVYPKDVNLPLAIDGLQNSNLFLTGFQTSTNLSFQINYAFNNDVYFYTFGDKLSMASITGVGFPDKACGKGAQMNSTPKNFIKFYRKNKLGTATQPLHITVGGMKLSGFFVSLNINLVAGKQNTYTFVFSFLGRVTG